MGLRHGAEAGTLLMTSLKIRNNVFSLIVRNCLMVNVQTLS